MLSKFSNFSGPFSSFNHPSNNPEIISLLLYLDSSYTQSSNLIINGDFSAGATGFTTDYTYNLDVGNNPQNVNPNWNPIGDHTTGSGNMLIIDASFDLINFWMQTVSVAPNTNYAFTFWCAPLYENFPNIEVLINGESVYIFTPSTLDTWEQVQFVWNSGTNSTANISMRDTNLGGAGNDFAIDDISFFSVNIFDNIWYDITNNHNDFTFDNTVSIKNYWSNTIDFYKNYASGKNLGSLSKFTLETWVNIKDAIPSSCFFADAFDGGNINMYCRLDADGNIESGFYNNSDGFHTSQVYTPDLNRWYYLVTTVDKDNLTFYINGETYSTTSISRYNKPSSSGLSYFIGKKWDDDTKIDANLSVIKVWNGALTYSTINQTYNSLLDRFYYVLNVEPSTWDESPAIVDTRNNLTGSMSNITYSTFYDGVLKLTDTSNINFGTVEPLTQNGDISFLIWVKFTNFNLTDNSLVNKYGLSSDFNFSVKDISGKGTGPYSLCFNTKNDSDIFDIAEINLNTWYLLGFTLQNDGDLKYYINGSFSSTSSPISRSLNYADDFAISNSTSGSGINGYIGEFKFYNRVLTSNEISNYYLDTTSRYQGIPASLVFDGNRSYLSGTIPTKITTSPFTIEAWFYSNNYDKISGIISFRVNATQPPALAINLNSGFLEITYGNSIYTYIIPPNFWHHVAIVRNDKDEFVIYLDGEPLQKITKSETISVKDFVIGRYWVDYNDYYFDGLITNIRINNKVIYSGAFTPSISKLTADINTQMLIPVYFSTTYNDITENVSITNFNVGITASVPTMANNGLIIYLDATNANSYNRGNVWYDISGNANDATLYNGYTFSASKGGAILFDGSGVLYRPDLASRGEISADLSGGDHTIIYGTRYMQNTNGLIPSGRSLGGLRNNWLLGTYANAVDKFFTPPTSFIYPSNSTDLNWHIYTGVMGSQTKFWDNDTPLVSSNSPNAVGPNGIVLASDGIFGESANCEISFLLVYNRCLTDEEILSIYNQFKGRLSL